MLTMLVWSAHKFLEPELFIELYGGRIRVDYLKNIGAVRRFGDDMADDGRGNAFAICAKRLDI